jgi:hypothetical protein
MVLTLFNAPHGYSSSGTSATEEKKKNSIERGTA